MREEGRGIAVDVGFGRRGFDCHLHGSPASTGFVQSVEGDEGWLLLPALAPTGRMGAGGAMRRDDERERELLESRGSSD